MLDEYVLLFLLCGIIILLSVQQRRRIKKYHEYMELYRQALEEGDEKKAKIYKSYAEEHSHWWFI